jgi:hypothetical protein
MFDVGRFAELLQRFPSHWEGLQPYTWVWCLHCEQAFQFQDARINPRDGLLMCGYWPDCDASAFDFWPWSQEDWEQLMGSQPRPTSWPQQPEIGRSYPLYPERS